MFASKWPVAVTVVIFILAGFSLSLFAEGNHEPAGNSQTSKTTYLGQNPPGRQAELFAPEVLKHEPHDSPIISRDETGIIFFGMESGIRYYATVDGRLTQVSNPFDFEYPPVCNGSAFTPSENRVYVREWKNGGEHLYRIDRTADGWSDPYYMDLSILGTWQFTVASSENLYFSSDRIMVSVYDGQNHAKPTSLKLEDGTNMVGKSPYVPPDESYIIYSIDGDLHISYNMNNGKWTMPISPGSAVNSDQMELCPQVSPNGKYLFFNSRRNFPDWAIYWVDAGFITEFKPEGLN